MAKTVMIKEKIMVITKEQLIESLNHDLELEYSSAIQYVNHSETMGDSVDRDIITLLETSAEDEMQHLMILAAQIGLIGGEPLVKGGEIKVSRLNQNMLKQDLEREQEAIRRYGIRIKQAEGLEEFELARCLRVILHAEQRHAEDLKRTLRSLREMAEYPVMMTGRGGNYLYVQ